MTPGKKQNQSVVPHDVALYQLVGALCFTENRAIWVPESEEARLIKKVREGASVYDLNERTASGAVSAFTTGLLLFSFYIYSHIGKQYMAIDTVDSESKVTVAFFDGVHFTFDPWKPDTNLLAFFEKSLSLLCGANQPVLTREVFQQLSRMFDATHERFEREVALLKRIIKADSLLPDMLESDSFNPNVFSLVLSSLPAQELNSLFMIIGRSFGSDHEVVSVNGVSINAREFLTRDTVDLFELFNKIRFLIVLYTEQRILLFDLLSKQEIRSYIDYLMSNETVRRSIKNHIQDTIDGQYIPRVKTMRAFQRILR